MSHKQDCPVCELPGVLNGQGNPVVLTCANCQSILATWSAEDRWFVLEEGMQMEEDWEWN